MKTWIQTTAVYGQRDDETFGLVRWDALLMEGAYIVAVASGASEKEAIARVRREVLLQEQELLDLAS